MISLPIPSALDRLDYARLRCPTGQSYAEIIETLAAGARIDGRGAHLDPDLYARARPRKVGWRPAFGQRGAAAGHLNNQGVGVGDLFLFYGWFRHAHHVDGRLQFVRGHSGFHAIYAYLEVGSVVRPHTDDLPAWLRDHPHAAHARRTDANNAIYVANDRLTRIPTTAGAGMLRYRPARVLSKPGLTRSRWALDPHLFRKRPISYHSDAAWRAGYFQSYPRAQEYVIDADEPVIEWVHGLITTGR